MAYFRVRRWVRVNRSSGRLNVALETKGTRATTGGQVQGWLAERLTDKKWVAETKALSDKADAQMRAKGLLPSK